jgi:hypothetical protein
VGKEAWAEVDSDLVTQSFSEFLVGCATCNPRITKTMVASAFRKLVEISPEKANSCGGRLGVRRWIIDHTHMLMSQTLV